MPYKNMSSDKCGQRTPRWHCADAKPDQGLHCLLLTESLDTAKMYELRSKAR